MYVFLFGSTSKAPHCLPRVPTFIAFGICFYSPGLLRVLTFCCGCAVQLPPVLHPEAGHRVLHKALRASRGGSSSNNRQIRF